MNTYMISIQLPDQLTEEFVSLIPKQRKQIDELMDNGKILQYSFRWIVHNYGSLSLHHPSEG